MSRSTPPSDFEEKGISALRPTLPLIHEALKLAGTDDWTLGDVTDAVGVMWHINCEGHLKDGITQGHLKYCWLLLKEAVEFIFVDTLKYGVVPAGLTRQLDEFSWWKNEEKSEKEKFAEKTVIVNKASNLVTNSTPLIEPEFVNCVAGPAGARFQRGVPADRIPIWSRISPYPTFMHSFTGIDSDGYPRLTSFVVLGKDAYPCYFRSIDSWNMFRSHYPYLKIYMDRWPKQSPRDRQLERKVFARMIVIWVVAPHPSSAEWKLFNTRATQLRIGALHRGLELYRKYITDKHGEFYEKEYLERHGLLTLCGFYDRNVKHFQPEGGHKYPFLDKPSISNCAWNIHELDDIARNLLISESKHQTGAPTTASSSCHGRNRELSPINHDRYRPSKDTPSKPQGCSTPYDRNDSKRFRTSK